MFLAMVVVAVVKALTIEVKQVGLGAAESVRA
jgi:hypothetical protein